MLDKQVSRGLGFCLVALMACSTAAIGEGRPAHRQGRAHHAAREFGQRLAAQAGLKDENAVKFVKLLETYAKDRRESRRSLKASMDELETAYADGKGQPAQLNKALDRLQKAVLEGFDSRAATMRSARELMSPAEQARFLLSRKGWKFLTLPGMKQAVPALIGYFRDDFLNSVAGLDPAARGKIASIGDRQMTRRVELVDKMLQRMGQLEEAGAEGKGVAELLDGLAADGASLRETVAEQIVETRKAVPELELARVLLAFKGKLHSFGLKLGFLREAVKD